MIAAFRPPAFDGWLAGNVGERPGIGFQRHDAHRQAGQFGPVLEQHRVELFAFGDVGRDQFRIASQLERSGQIFGRLAEQGTVKRGEAAGLFSQIAEQDRRTARGFEAGLLPDDLRLGRIAQQRSSAQIEPDFGLARLQFWLQLERLPLEHRRLDRLLPNGLDVAADLVEFPDRRLPDADAIGQCFDVVGLRSPPPVADG